MVTITDTDFLSARRELEAAKAANARAIANALGCWSPWVDCFSYDINPSGYYTLKYTNTVCKRRQKLLLLT